MLSSRCPFLPLLWRADSVRARTALLRFVLITETVTLASDVMRGKSSPSTNSASEPPRVSAFVGKICMHLLCF